MRKAICSMSCLFGFNAFPQRPDVEISNCSGTLARLYGSSSNARDFGVLLHPPEWSAGPVAPSGPSDRIALILWISHEDYDSYQWL